MANGNYYAKKLSKEEVISNLNNFLDIIRNDYAFLWDGDQSLISKYGRFNTMEARMNSASRRDKFQKVIPLHNNIPCINDEGFDSLAIVNNNGDFKFYLEKQTPNSVLYEEGSEVYDALSKQFDIHSSFCINSWARSIYENLEMILNDDSKKKLEDLKDKLKIN